jgi:hypothetical protein
MPIPTSRYNGEIETEIANAVSARNAGLEGRARVCARRAAGKAAEYYLSQFQIGIPDLYERLTYMLEMPDLHPELHPFLEHFVMKVDENYNLPDGIDLINDARQFTKIIFNISKETQK